MKTKGLEVESAQMGSGSALKKLTVLSLQIAISLMNLKHAIDQPDLNINASAQFTNAELKLLSMLLLQVEGKTTKQKNPYYRNSMAWAAWILARLDNWSGYSSHGPPGYITIKNGLAAFNILAKGYEIAIKPCIKISLLREKIFDNKINSTAPSGFSIPLKTKLHNTIIFSNLYSPNKKKE